MDETTALIRVGGRLRQASHLSYSTAHPIVLDPKHPITRLLIKQYDTKLCHPGPERVFAEIRRYYWILRGREAIRRHQHSCVECQRWRAKPNIPKMAELPHTRLHLMKPADLDPVTPNYLLMGRPDASLPQVIYPEFEILSRKRWRHSQVLADQFWTSFIKNYLPTLQPCQKWMSDTSNLTPGTVVMIIDHQLPRALWPVGKVVTIYPGSDGRVRSAEIEVKNKHYHRPVSSHHNTRHPRL